MNRRNVAAGITCLAIAGTVYWLSGTVPTGMALDPLGGRWLPQALAVGLALFALALTVTGLLGVRVAGGQAPVVKPTEADTGEEETTSAPVDEDAGSLSTVAAYVAVMGVYVWLMPIIGFLLTSFAAFTVMIVLLGQRNLARALVGATVITGGLYALFGVLFGVRLPAGILF